MTDENYTTIGEKMSISEKQADSLGISDWILLKEIGAQQNAR